MVHTRKQIRIDTCAMTPITFRETIGAKHDEKKEAFEENPIEERKTRKKTNITIFKPVYLTKRFFGWLVVLCASQ